ncbi:glycoside hydrolase family 25 protein [Flavobacterium oreochromis]|uniref:Glycoside hydrolase n=2 Tax=Flavobacterium TaxID=237 RepID=A0A246GE51_9FLAO|nr:glycoside hydrolase family 25 protein [Flavobacterium oreochromis]OWP76055.1 glycoside hydrolase [Flavobacterium oreochromis]OWP79640.1 glycoside hydrolase [Flavobacterium oreochromis]POR20709.1 glycoside hydrolase [Flavobacterium columnare]
MAQKKYSKTVKKGTNTRAKKSSQTKVSFFSSSLFFKLVMILSIVVLFYSQKNIIARYLGFTTDKIIYAEARSMPIDEVLDTHIEKSFGIDLSEYQDDIDWSKIKEIEGGYPIEFVFIRATAGSNKIDKKFKKYWLRAKEKGFIVGAYHYYRPNENSIEQAENFIKQVTLIEGDFPPVLDIEKLPKTQSIDRLKIGLKRWLEKVEEHYGVKPIIYSSESYYQDFLKDDFEDYPFWIANYTAFYKKIDSEWSIWQLTENGKIPGVKGPVDVNIYNGTSVTMKDLLIH